MSVPVLPYSVSDHPLDCLRKITKSIDKLCSDLNKLHEKDLNLYNYMVRQLITLQIRVHPYKWSITSQDHKRKDQTMILDGQFETYKDDLET